MATPDWICPCGGGPEEATNLLHEFLEIFSQTDSVGHPYLDLDRCDAFTKKYTYGVYHLLFCLLEKAGYVQHHNSVNSSAFLPVLGEELRDSLRESHV